MMKTVTILRRPWDFPEWGEVTLAFLGLIQFIAALIMFDELIERNAYDITLYFSPEGWAAAGAIIFVAHIVGLRFAEQKWGYNFRLGAAGVSCAFWVHFILSLVAKSVFFDTLFPGNLVPALAAPLFAGAVLYRLWRHY